MGICDPLDCHLSGLGVEGANKQFFGNARPPTALSLPSRPGDFGTSTRGSFNQLRYMYPSPRVRGIVGCRFRSIGDGAKTKISQSVAASAIMCPERGKSKDIPA